VTLAEGSPVDGKTVREIEFPTDSSLVAVVRDGHVIAPRGETPLHAGDEVLAIASIQAETELRRALTGQ